MIERLRGQLLEKDLRHIVIDCGGVGYGLSISSITFESLPVVGDPVDVFVHTHVREDALELYGFLHRQDRELFLLLQTISGVGPALALTLLSSMAPSAIAKAVETGDSNALRRIKGVGQRTAERLILELKGKLKGFQFDGTDDQVNAGALHGNSSAKDAIAALMHLGLKEPQAEKAVLAALSSLPDGVTTEQLVVEGLKWRKN
jgi:Holliday junction DNA helicase RuvA